MWTTVSLGSQLRLFVCLFVSQGGTSVNCYLSLASLIGQLYLWPKSNQSNFPRLSFYGVTLLYFMASHVSDLHWEQECTPVFLLKISPFYSGHSSESRILYFQISIPALSQARPGCLFIQKPGGRDWREIWEEFKFLMAFILITSNATWNITANLLLKLSAKYLWWRNRQSFT